MIQPIKNPTLENTEEILSFEFINSETVKIQGVSTQSVQSAYLCSRLIKNRKQIANFI